MKVVYLKKAGNCQRGDVKEVAEGHFRNFLAPQGLAVLATSENINKVKADLQKQVKEKQDVLATVKSLVTKLRGKKIEIKAKANEMGKFYAAVSEEEIRKELKRLGFNLGEAKISGQHHLKEVGDYEVKIDFGHSINCNIKVAVRI